MNRPISAAYLERKLRAIVGVGGSNPLPDLGDVTGLITLESDRPEWRITANEQLFDGFFNSGAVVAEQLTLLIHNPPSSGVIAVLTHLHQFTIATNVFFGNNDPTVVAPPWGVVNGANRDTRGLSGLGFTCAVKFYSATLTAAEVTTLTAGGILIDRVEVGVAGSSIYHERTYILSPGYWIAFIATAANVAGMVSLHGYERPLEGRFEVK